jgi:hypothetical protein
MVLAAVHVLPAQQVSPTPPHISQMRRVPAMPAHSNVGPLQVTLAQQG